MSTVPPSRSSTRSRSSPELVKSRGYKNKHQVPQLVKIVINTGIDAEADKNQIADIQRDLTLIAGQKPVLAKPAKAISNFKLKQGQIVGCHVTLRGNAMWEFLYRLIAVALPTHPRLPRRLAQARRPGQLQPRDHRFHHLPGNHRGERQEDHGHRHHDRHHRQDRRRGPRAPPPARHALPPRRARRRPETARRLNPPTPPAMPKTSAIERNKKRSAPRREIRQAARRAQGHPRQSGHDRRGIFRRAEEAPKAPAQRLAGADPQPLLAQRPAARLPPQVRRLAHHLSRTRPRRQDPRRHQILLVTALAHGGRI